jgi:hypothetical protein
MRIMVFNKPKNPSIWYNDLEGKMIDLDKILLEENEEYYYVNIRGEKLPIEKHDLNPTEEMELDLPQEVLDGLDKVAREKNISVDELINMIIRDEFSKDKNKKD